jgi:serine/threonine-protein kinase
MEPVLTPRVFSNRYELTHLIARGGMAQVFRARDRLLDRPVAIKVLFPELSVDRAFVERFRREAQAAANLSHPNIVPVFDWGEDGGTYFIVMEFVDGQPLSALLRTTGPLAPAKVADVGVPVAAALAYAHRHGVIHRDVKPGNVLITDDGEVKVTDFGIARAVNTEESLTQTGAVMGTATYFSPEQAEGVGVDARSDIYSLGVVLYEMVAGRPPFLGETPVAVASKHVRDEPPDLRDLAPAVPPVLEAVIMKAMAKSPDDRYSNADELRSDLLRFADGRPVLAAEVASTRVERAAGAAPTGMIGRTQVVPADDDVLLGEEYDPVAAARRRRTRWLIAGLIGLLVVLVVLAVLLLRSLGYLGGGSFALPDVVGRTVASATGTLEGDGLVLGPTAHVRSSTVAKGDVLATSPAAGATVRKGDRVTLTVSTGKPPVVTPKSVMVVVPSVTGTLLTDAEAVLQSATLKYKVTLVTSNTPANTVLSQNPGAGASVKQGSTVVLSVAKPNTNVTVPDVVGKTAAQAGSTLGASGLQADTSSQQCTTSFGKGLVLETNPGAGASVAKSSVVDLIVSTGPCKGTIPTVIGKKQTTAESTLSGEGFTSVTVSPVTTKTPAQRCAAAQNGTVVAETPTAGTSVATSAKVTIYVCTVSTTPSSTTTSTTPKATTPKTPTPKAGG